jgi:hypothetical protein
MRLPVCPAHMQPPSLPPTLPLPPSSPAQYFISLRFGHLMDRQRLKALLEGKVEREWRERELKAGQQGQ